VEREIESKEKEARSQTYWSIGELANWSIGELKKKVSAILNIKVKILTKKEVAPNIFLIKLSALSVAQDALPGQFIHIKCGKDNCWCTKAHKGHPACYLSILIGEKRKMIYVPKAKEKQVRELVRNYKEITKSLVKISKYCLKRFRKE